MLILDINTAIEVVRQLHGDCEHGIEHGLDRDGLEAMQENLDALETWLDRLRGITCER